MEINGKFYTKEEVQEIANKCFNRTDFAKMLGWNYYNGKLSKKIDQIVKEMEISIEHFDPTKKNKARRKYPIIIKNCPVCNIEFETQQGHPHEKITCSTKCANTFFSDQKHGPEQRLKTSRALIAFSGSTAQTELVGDDVLFKIVCEFCGAIFFSSNNSNRFCSQNCINQWRSGHPEIGEKISFSIRKRIEAGLHKGWASRSKLTPSFPEQVVIGILQELNIHLERELKVGRWFIDFADIDKKIAIEIDGSQHKWPERQLSDAKKDEYLISQGWEINRIPWKRLTKETREELKQRIIDILIRV